MDISQNSLSRNTIRAIILTSRNVYASLFYLLKLCNTYNLEEDMYIFGSSLQRVRFMIASLLKKHVRRELGKKTT